jgi:hypothetical protein
MAQFPANIDLSSLDGIPGFKLSDAAVGDNSPAGGTSAARASAYYSCVRTSFASQLPTMVDRNMAIDQAFKVCQTEESKLQTFENVSENVSGAAISAHPQHAQRRTLAAIGVRSGEMTGDVSERMSSTN